ncbi:hypothetical protein BGZ75_000305 [Mortierella antarctica]|nr:hypothetical protein BGZ75_000305 [Mortierella antarctica]
MNSLLSKWDTPDLHTFSPLGTCSGINQFVYLKTSKDGSSPGQLVFDCSRDSIYYFDKTLFSDLGSPLCLYRLGCTLPSAVRIEKTDKSAWWSALTHRASGKFFGFADIKGSVALRIRGEEVYLREYRRKNGDRRSVWDAMDRLEEQQSKDNLEKPYLDALPQELVDNLSAPAMGDPALLEELSKFVEGNRVFKEDMIELLSYLASDQCAHGYDDLVAGLLALVSSVLADVTYNVIGFPDARANTFAVEVNGELHPLRSTKDSFPLWSTKVMGVSAPSSYRYVQLNHNKRVVAREEFVRSLTGRTTTPNEFFNRENTFTVLPGIKQVYKDVRPKDIGVFDGTQIATIHLTMDPAKFEDMMNHPKDENRERVPATFRFINAHKVYSTNDVKVKISGHGSRKFRKVSLHVEFEKTKKGMFFDRSAIKLRAEYNDPTMIREKLYLDLLDSVGVGSSQGSFTRVYVNGKPHGLFLMVEDIGESMLMQTIHHGAIKDVNALGSLYQMGTTVEFKGMRAASYQQNLYKNIIQGNNPKDEPMKQFIAFMKDLEDWDPADTKGVAYWKERLDLDGFLRSMALEYLTGAFDSFWWNAHNYYMYFNPQRKIWQFIPIDFDHSFSAGRRLDVDETYKEYAQTCEGSNAKSRPMVSKLICKNKDINKRFETILLTITRGVFNYAALENRVYAYETQMQEEVAWDFAIDRSKRPGLDFGWDFNNFHKTIWGPFPKKAYKGIMPWVRSRVESVANQFAM